jgi:hypothetical protein
MPTPDPIPAESLTKRIDAFLASRGLASKAHVAPDARVTPVAPDAPVAPVAPSRTPSHPGTLAPEGSVEKAATFVCEDDVRTAVKAGRKILVNEKTIITPAARDAGEAAKVFLWEGYR